MQSVVASMILQRYDYFNIANNGGLIIIMEPSIGFVSIKDLFRLEQAVVIPAAAGVQQAVVVERVVVDVVVVYKQWIDTSMCIIETLGNSYPKEHFWVSCSRFRLICILINCAFQ